MIDVTKCEFEESFTDKNEGFTRYYFLYPTDLSEMEFYSEEDYGDVVCMCLSVTVYNNGDCCLAMSPTVFDGEALTDVDWRDLFVGENYLPESILALLKKVRE